MTDDVERISNVGAGLGSLSRILKNLIIFTNLSKKVLEVFAERIFIVVIGGYFCRLLPTEGFQTRAIWSYEIKFKFQLEYLICIIPSSK